jgi:very-short-patch-repair endonuclease
VRTWADQLADDEIAVVGGICVTTPARTALDLARRNQLGVAVSAIDALGQATDLKPADVELLAQRYRGRRGIARARVAVDLVDTGAESPKETWLRLLLIRAGLPRPQTQIAVRNVFGWIEARVDMGWEELKVAAEYDGDQHRSDRRQFVRDVHRLEFLERAGWIVVRVVAEDHPDDIVRRVRDARARRA